MEHTEAHPARYTSPVAVYVILFIATIVEVGATLLGVPRNLLVPALLAISFVKAALVALYFMHLRYEKIVYGLIFITPALFAILLMVVLATH
ncbi:MAG: cytochrome C oxidase subunit IV family protein [Thermoflexales bacterium]|nr:cytochrome C oxidase subunit IV family protein [Thermoflexales bacterium]